MEESQSEHLCAGQGHIWSQQLQPDGSDVPPRPCAQPSSSFVAPRFPAGRWHHLAVDPQPAPNSPHPLPVMLLSGNGCDAVTQSRLQPKGNIQHSLPRLRSGVYRECSGHASDNTPCEVSMVTWLEEPSCGAAVQHADIKSCPAQHSVFIALSRAIRDLYKVHRCRSTSQETDGSRQLQFLKRPPHAESSQATSSLGLHIIGLPMKG